MGTKIALWMMSLPPAINTSRQAFAATLSKHPSRLFWCANRAKSRPRLSVSLTGSLYYHGNTLGYRLGRFADFCRKTGTGLVQKSVNWVAKDLINHLAKGLINP